MKKRLLAGASTGVVVVLLVFALSRLWVFQSFELRTLDWRQQLLAAPTETVEKVAIIMVDDYSVRVLRETDKVYWPWPRDVYETILLYLKEAGARCVIFDLIFEDPQGKGGENDPDRIFANAAKTFGKVAFAVKLAPALAGVPQAREAAAIAKARVPAEGWAWPPREGNDVLIAPVPELVEAATGLGLVNVVQDGDNTLRRADLIYPYPDSGSFLCSLGFEAARLAIGRDEKAVVDGRDLVWAGRRIPLGRDGRLLVRYYGKEGAFHWENAASVVQSFLDVHEDEENPRQPRVPYDVFKDRVVFVGASMAGREDVVTAPVSSRFWGTEFIATVCANVLGEDFLREPGGAARFLILLLLGLAAGVLSFWIWKPLSAGLATFALLMAYSGGTFLAFRQGLVLDLFFPTLVFGGTFFGATLTAYFTEGRHKKEVSRAFAQYLSPVVIRDLMRDPDALKLGGETREVTVYFSDIQGFSTFSEGMSPHELVSFLNVYLSTMTDIVLDRRGVVDKYEGDAIMAFWGAPARLEDHAREACLAILDQRRALAILNERFRAEGRPAVNFRAGLNMGPAVVGNMGSSRRFSYTAMGDTVNLASRLEGANKFFGSSVMISEAVRQAAGDSIVTRPLGRIRVVGKSIPAAVHELLGRAGELSPEQSKRLETYRGALGLLEEGRASDAADLFEILSTEAPDPVVSVLLKRSREIAETGTTWDGVWVLTSKG